MKFLKKIATFVTCITLGFFDLCAMKCSEKAGAIPNASYFIYDGVDQTSVVDCGAGSSTHVTFYTSDGNKLETIKHNNRNDLETMLDWELLNKPQPVLCILKYVPCFPFCINETQKVSGWFVMFYDKNGFKIKSYPLDQWGSIQVIEGQMQVSYGFDIEKPHEMSSYFPLDLKKVEKIVIKNAIIKEQTLYSQNDSTNGSDFII